MTQGAEIGVDRATFSEWLYKNAPGLHLTCVDDWRPRLRGESRYKSTVGKLAPFGARIIRKASLQALADVEDESLDWVYIDADHRFDFVLTDIIFWTKKVKIGGVIAGHDFYAFRGGGVVQAVEAYTKMHGIDQWFVTDEKHPSWFWLKEQNPRDPHVTRSGVIEYGDGDGN